MLLNSVDSAAYSLPFHITIPHIITKLEDKIRFPRAYFFESLFKQFDQNISNNNQRYYSKASAILNNEALLPNNFFCVSLQK
jgi:hypothetical protein